MLVLIIIIIVIVIVIFHTKGSRYIDTYVLQWGGSRLSDGNICKCLSYLSSCYVGYAFDFVELFLFVLFKLRY